MMVTGARSAAAEFTDHTGPGPGPGPGPGTCYRPVDRYRCRYHHHRCTGPGTGDRYRYRWYTVAWRLAMLQINRSSIGTKDEGKILLGILGTNNEYEEIE